MKEWLPTLAIAVTLVACSRERQPAIENQLGDSIAPASLIEKVTVNTEKAAPVGPAASIPATNVLTLAGLGDLRIGQPIPAGSTWGERGAQESDTCRTISSPDFVGVYAIVEGRNVRRITVGQRSAIRLAENIGTGSSEQEFRSKFAGFRAEAHKYQAAPAKYLTAPSVADGKPGLRFEIDENRKVSLIHAGTMPVLAYVEGCS